MKQQQRVLILDDEEALRDIIAKRLERKGYQVAQAGTANEGVSFLNHNLVELVLLDLRLPDGEGLDVLYTLKKLQPDLQVVMLTGHGTMESAIEALKAGAFDYLTKPCNLSELEITLEKALEQRKLLVENTGLRQVMHRQIPELKIIGESAQLKNLLELTRKVASSDTAVLIQGESGVGKELIARALHLWSHRAAQAYIPVNAGAIPETLIESELFGHEKGAFTGAGGQKLGLVEMADRGTLFLDEIGEMPLQLQVKLLRFLETGEFRRVGDTRLRRVDVRIVTASNRDLHQEIEGGRFRQDLYYRLTGLSLRVPPLRERREDILPLCDYFLARLDNVALTMKHCFLAKETIHELIKYDFPGNVRELAHLLERGRLLSADGMILPKDIWPEKNELRKETEVNETLDSLRPIINDADKLKGHYPTLEEIERRYIIETLARVDGNRAQAAKLLGISVRNLYRKIEAYGK